MKKQFYVSIALILMLLSSAFYWFELRPSAIRKNCWDQSSYSQQDILFLKALKDKGYSKEDAFKALDEVKIGNGLKAKSANELEEQKRFNYEACVRNYGLKE